MSKPITPDSVIAKAQRLERLAGAAESLRNSIRVNGTFSWRTTRNLIAKTFMGEERVPDIQVTAMYEALVIVRDRFAEQARETRTLQVVPIPPEG